MRRWRSIPTASASRPGPWCARSPAASGTTLFIGLLYLFLYAPLLVIALFSFNDSETQTLPSRVHHALVRIPPARRRFIEDLLVRTLRADGVRAGRRELLVHAFTSPFDRRQHYTTTSAVCVSLRTAAGRPVSWGLRWLRTRRPAGAS